MTTLDSHPDILDPRLTTLDPAAPVTPRPATPDQERGHRFVFLSMLAEALAAYGMATHDLEDAVRKCADQLGIPARVSATPTSIVIMVGAEGEERTRLILPENAGVNLARLTELARVARRVEAGLTSARDGIEELRTALRARPAPSPISDALGAAAIAAAILVVLGAPLPDLAAGAAVGAIVAVVLNICASGARLARVASFAAAVAAAAAATLLHRFAGPIDLFPVTVAGLLPILPGLSLTIAIGEIASGSLVSGASRLIAALTVLLSLGFGVAVGFQVAGAAELALTLQITSVYPAWAQGAALVAAALAMVSAFRARWVDLPVILASCALSMFTARWASTSFGPELGSLVGAFTVGVAAMIYERLTRVPSQVALLPGILLLVPGSVGFRSVHSFLDADAIGGIEGVFTMFVIAVGIVTGLLLANVVTPPPPRSTGAESLIDPPN